MEEIGDLAIPKERLRMDPETTLRPSEVAACRASLGACVATQTELAVNRNMQVAKEVARERSVL